MPNKLELVLRKTGRILAEHQIAHLFKVPEEMQSTPVDFFGYTAAGRAILVEAKMVSRPSLPIGDSPGLQPHQWNALLDANRANCLALICWSRDDVVATIDVDMALELSKGRKSIPWTAIPDSYYRTLSSNSYRCLDLLDHWLRMPCSPES